MRRVSAVIVTLILSAILSALPARADGLRFVHPDGLVELFTSQGCSSCPPADAVLREFNDSDSILGLAFHVDYWDRLGWKDTFGSPDHTERQWRYARALGERQVYTPQAILNGRAHLVGSKKSAIVDELQSMTASGKGLSVPIALERVGDVVKLQIAADQVPGRATLYAVYYEPVANVEVERGENAGRQLTYSNIVESVDMLGIVGANGLSLEFSIMEMAMKDGGACALILQTSTENGLPGPIIGASAIVGL